MTTEGRLRVLVPIGDGPAPERPLEVLLPLDALRPVEVTLLSVARSPGERGRLRGTLDWAGELLRRRGLRVGRLRIGVGDPAAEIVSCARGGDFDWVVMATHGRRGLLRALLGSTTEEVLRRSPIPVLAFRPGIRRGPWERVAVALDGSREAEASLPDASRFAKACKTPLQLLRFHGPGGKARAEAYLEAVSARLAEQEVSSQPFRFLSTATRGIVSHLRRLDVGLLFMTTHGRTGLRRALRGSVAEVVLRRAPCAVLIRRR